METKNSTTVIIPDDLNPDFIFSGIATILLSSIAKGEIDCKTLAKQELENRGIDINGKWVGFNSKIL